MSHSHIGNRKPRPEDGWAEIKHQGSCFAQPWLTEHFFPGQGESQFEAMDICHGNEFQDACPILQQCLMVHLEEPYGIWGGTSERERRRMKWAYQRTGIKPVSMRVDATRRRGRPRRIA